MDMQLLPWIKDDVAIEIIGKMIAEQMQEVYALVNKYQQAGYGPDSQEVLTDNQYQQLMQRIGKFKQEIDQIYEGKGLEKLYRKVDRTYVPHLNRQHNQVENHIGTENSSNESNWSVYISEGDKSQVITPQSSVIHNPSSLQFKVVESKRKRNVVIEKGVKQTG